MRAGLRLGFAVLAAALALGPLPALAQEAVQPTTTTTPATAAVGPRELQNFNLQGTVTRPAEQTPAPRASAPPAPRSVERAAATSSQAQTTTPGRTAQRSEEPRRTSTGAGDRPRPAERSVESLRQTPPSSSVTVALPSLSNDAVHGSAARAAPASDFSAEAGPGSLASEHKLSILPWLLAALALAAGVGFLLWRNRSREAFAGAQQLDSYLAPEPGPAPTPAPASRPVPAPKATPPSIPGIVSTRLRPWIEIGFHPLRCIVEDERVTIQFDIELYNSGSAPARAVLIEASLFNAGPSQDRDIGEFFASPVGEGERIVAIAPLKRMNIRTQVVAERGQVQVYEVAGRQVFVPLIAFNALYRWTSGEGQTSVSYLLGRDTKGEKMAPFRLDLGPRMFRGVGAHPLPTGVRS
jgi:hypothetical protein